MDINATIRNYGHTFRSHVLLILMAFFFVVLSFGFICGSNTISLKVLYSSKTTVIEGHAVYDDPKGRDGALYYSLKVTYNDPKGNERESEINDVFQPNPEFSNDGYDIFFFNLGNGSYIVDEFQIKNENEVLYHQKNPVQFSVSIDSSQSQSFSIPMISMLTDDTDPDDKNDTTEGDEEASAPPPEQKPDSDNDTIPDESDNCAPVANQDQLDDDSDGVGNVCDNCPSVSNPDQKDDNEFEDGEGLGDVCETSDPDGDGYSYGNDNCPLVGNDQADYDKDSIGDACDNCPNSPNQDQANRDSDDLGDVCDSCPLVVNVKEDSDADSIDDACDNCPDSGNRDQIDSDGDARGDVCDICPTDRNQGVSITKIFLSEEYYPARVKISVTGTNFCNLFQDLEDSYIRFGKEDITSFCGDIISTACIANWQDSVIVFFSPLMFPKEYTKNITVVKKLKDTNEERVSQEFTFRVLQEIQRKR